MTSIFPVLSSLTELLTGSVTDDFKKLIKPGPLVAAAIFLALNQVLVLPALRQHRIAVILAFESLSTTWQVLLGTFILFVSGYLLNASGTTFVNLISGQIIRDTWLGDKGVARQRQILEGLLAKLRAYADDETGDEAVRTAASLRVAGNEAAFQFALTISSGDHRMRIEPIDVMVFDREGRISSMKAYWSPGDVTPV